MTFKRVDNGWPAVRQTRTPTSSAMAPQGLILTAVLRTLDVYVLEVRNATTVFRPDIRRCKQERRYRYEAVNLGHGTWKASIDLGSHAGLRTVHVHCYTYGGPKDLPYFAGYGNFIRKQA